MNMLKHQKELLNITNSKYDIISDINKLIDDKSTSINMLYNLKKFFENENILLKVYDFFYSYNEIDKFNVGVLINRIFNFLSNKNLKNKFYYLYIKIKKFYTNLQIILNDIKNFHLTKTQEITIIKEKK